MAHATIAMAGPKSPPQYPAKKKLAEYFQENFWITTSGNFRTQTLIDAMLEIGADRILFSTDWPFENIDHAADWFDSATISEADRLKIGRTNTEKLFKNSDDSFSRPLPLAWRAALVFALRLRLLAASRDYHKRVFSSFFHASRRHRSGRASRRLRNAAHAARSARSVPSRVG